MGIPLNPAKPLNVGVIGCGAIIAQYLTNFRRLESVNLVAVADLDPARAQAVADSYEGVRALSVEGLLAADDVELVLNLTIPAAHAEIALKAIAAGKSVYGEKPLAATTTEAKEVLEAASAAGVLVGCAPDTVLGTGIQTARKAIDDGLIGAPVSATATMATPGHERWHPNPDFYYQPGGGPLLDMGPYYVSALVTLLGPVVSVVGAASHTRNERTIGSGPREGQKVPVDIESHVTGVGPRFRCALHPLHELRRRENKEPEHRDPRRKGVAGRPGSQPFRRGRAALRPWRRGLGSPPGFCGLQGLGPRLRHR